MEKELWIYYMWHSPQDPFACHHEYGRYLLNRALKNEYGIDFTEDMIDYKKYGKPVLRDSPIQFSISHCRGMAVCALSSFAVGVDAEGLRRVTNALINRTCCEQEGQYVKGNGCAKESLRFLRLWTLKESYLKMTGEGLRAPLDQVQFEIKKEPEVGEWITPGEISCCKQGSFWQIELKKDYILSVCMEKLQESSLLLRKAPMIKEILHC